MTEAEIKEFAALIADTQRSPRERDMMGRVLTYMVETSTIVERLAERVTELEAPVTKPAAGSNQKKKEPAKAQTQTEGSNDEA